ncbi:hypothetical protein EVAR_31290_1 [Eumeta japonica]|uniref:Uncharacterized protein n=1 Tax=Eumeta variegata TaxID=151549 RepID=A0A4C1VTM6_EUMVA|nr:hypothetical protein EVAR_31290_1 [Eumeta japonica]
MGSGDHLLSDGPFGSRESNKKKQYSICPLNEGVQADQRRRQYTCGWDDDMQVDDIIASISAVDYIDIDYVQIPIIQDIFSSS